MYKLEFYVPETHLDIVKHALFSQGAGRYSGYEHCCWQVRGTGQFMPLEASQPFIGQHGQLETVVEYKVEMICSAGVVKAVVQTLLRVHPYEEPAYALAKLMTLEDV